MLRIFIFFVIACSWAWSDTSKKPNLVVNNPQLVKKINLKTCIIKKININKKEQNWIFIKLTGKQYKSLQRQIQIQKSKLKFGKAQSIKLTLNSKQHQAIKGALSKIGVKVKKMVTTPLVKVTLTESILDVSPKNIKSVMLNNDRGIISGKIEPLASR